MADFSLSRIREWWAEVRSLIRSAGGRRVGRVEDEVVFMSRLAPIRVFISSGRRSVA